MFSLFVAGVWKHFGLGYTLKHMHVKIPYLSSLPPLPDLSSQFKAVLKTEENSKTFCTGLVETNKKTNFCWGIK
jgi:hypothetical protein